MKQDKKPANSPGLYARKHMKKRGRPAFKDFKSAKQCRTFNCGNTSDEGRFVGNFCFPCYEFITTGKGKYNRVFQNALMHIGELLTMSYGKRVQK